jgi:hypothetical protein
MRPVSRRWLIRGVVLGLGVVAFTVAPAYGADCLDRFPEGRFGIPLAHPAVANIKQPGFSALYVVKRSINVSRLEDCEYVYTGDVFRLRDTSARGALLAGCVGDFRGDGTLDVALLMKRQRDGAVVPFVFRTHGAEHVVTEIDPIVDPYGFAEDKTTWPGPFCISKPPSGVFKSWVNGDSVKVIGDLFTIGWKTYFWDPTTSGFVGILTND